MYVLVATLTSGPLGVRCPRRGTPGGWGWGGGVVSCGGQLVRAWLLLLMR